MPAATRGAPIPDEHAAAPGQAPECQICPICAGLAALRSARPEAVEHLVRAGGDAAARDDGLQRIDIG
jgi:hypothetical protein